MRLNQGSNVEQLNKKTRELEVMAAVCKINPDSVIDDIAFSGEATNKLTQSLQSKDKTKDPHLQWWEIFLKEWSYKCVVKWLDQYGDSKDYQRMQNSWFRFEILWAIACDIVRITRLNDLSEAVSSAIARKPPSEADLAKADIEEIWRWHNENTKQLDETVLKMIEVFKKKQRQAITQTLKEFEEYDKASLLGKLKRLMSTYL